MKEFGAGQFEVTIGPQRGVDDRRPCADRPRDACAPSAAAHGRQATFTPIRDPAGVGQRRAHPPELPATGTAGRRPTIADREHGLSQAAGQFVAGILKYLDSIVAITAPSVISYLRLTPHRWSAAFNNLGFRDREAAVRICPVSDISDVERAAQFNFEFRAADAAASPLPAACRDRPRRRAGHRGGARRAAGDRGRPLAARRPTRSRRAAMSACRKRLPEALDRFAANPDRRGLVSSGFADTYVKHKQGEIAFLKGRDQAEICQAYEEVY